MNYDPMRRWGCVSVMLGYVIAAAALILLFVSCTRTVYTPVESVRTEYRDRDGWHKSLEYVHDTCYVERTDSIQVPYPVERKLTRWQQAKMDLGGIALGVLAVVLCAAVVWLIRKFKR